MPGSSIALNLAVVALWALSRTVGLPAGPDAGTAEAIGTSDVLATGRALVALAVGALVMAGLTTPALAASEAGAPLRSLNGYRSLAVRPIPLT